MWVITYLLLLSIWVMSNEFAGFCMTFHVVLRIQKSNSIYLEITGLLDAPHYGVIHHNGKPFKHLAMFGSNLKLSYTVSPFLAQNPKRWSVHRMFILFPFLSPWLLWVLVCSPTQYCMINNGQQREWCKMESSDGHCLQEMALKAHCWPTASISHQNIHAEDLF